MLCWSRPTEHCQWNIWRALRTFRISLHEAHYHEQLKTNSVSRKVKRRFTRRYQVVRFFAARLHPTRDSLTFAIAYWLSGAVSFSCKHIYFTLLKAKYPRWSSCNACKTFKVHKQWKDKNDWISRPSKRWEDLFQRSRRSSLSWNSCHCSDVCRLLWLTFMRKLNRLKCNGLCQFPPKIQWRAGKRHAPFATLLYHCKYHPSPAI